MSRYFDRKGNPITSEQWSAGFCDMDKKRVAFDKLPDAEVSTVWLGLDHSYGDGPPLIFETLVFGGTLDQEMDRYSSEAEALAGHAKMVQRVRLAHVDFAH